MAGRTDRTDRTGRTGSDGPTGGTLRLSDSANIVTFPATQRQGMYGTPNETYPIQPLLTPNQSGGGGANALGGGNTPITEKDKKDLLRNLQVHKTDLIQAQKTLEKYQTTRDRAQRDQETKLKDQEKTIAAKESEIVKLKGAVKQLTLKGSNSRQEAEYQSALTKIEKISQDYHKAVKKNEIVEDQIKQQTAKLATLTREAETLKRTVATKDERIKQFQSKAEQATAAEQQKQEEVNEALAKLTNTKEEQTGLLAQLHTNQLHITSQKQTLEEKEDQIHALQAESQVQKAKIIDLRKVMKSFQDETAAAQAASRKARGDIENGDAKIEDLERDLRTAQISSKKQHEQIVEKNGEIKDLEATLQTLEENNEALETKIKEANAKITSLEADLKAKNAELVQSEQELADLQAKLEESKIENTQLNSDLDEAAAELVQKEIELDEAKQRFLLVQTDLQAAEAKILEKTNLIITQTQNEDELKGQLAQVQDELRKANDKLPEIKKDNADVQLKIDTLTQENGEMKTNLDALRVKETTQSSELKDLQVKLERAEVKGKTDAQSLQTLNAEIEAANAVNAEFREDAQKQSFALQTSTDQNAQLSRDLEQHKVNASTLQTQLSSIQQKAKIAITGLQAFLDSPMSELNQWDATFDNLFSLNTTLAATQSIYRDPELFTSVKPTVEKESLTEWLSKTDEEIDAKKLDTEKLEHLKANICIPVLWEDKEGGTNLTCFKRGCFEGDKNLPDILKEALGDDLKNPMSDKSWFYFKLDEDSIGEIQNSNEPLFEPEENDWKVHDGGFSNKTVFEDWCYDDEDDELSHYGYIICDTTKDSDSGDVKYANLPQTHDLAGAESAGGAGDEPSASGSGQESLNEQTARLMLQWLIHYAFFSPTEGKILKKIVKTKLDTHFWISHMYDASHGKRPTNETYMLIVDELARFSGSWNTSHINSISPRTPPATQTASAANPSFLASTHEIEKAEFVRQWNLTTLQTNFPILPSFGFLRTLIAVLGQNPLQISDHELKEKADSTAESVYTVNLLKQLPQQIRDRAVPDPAIQGGQPASSGTPSYIT